MAAGTEQADGTICITHPDLSTSDLENIAKNIQQTLGQEFTSCIQETMEILKSTPEIIMETIEKIEEL
jgi:hypothetical protein